MDTLILYYSRTGQTKKLAEKIARDQNADIAEIKTLKPIGNLKAFFIGCPNAIKGRGWSVDIKGVNLDNYSDIVLMGPVWAGNFAPPVIGAAEMIPEGKNIKLISVSAATGVNPNKIKSILNQRNCFVNECKDYILKENS